MIEPYREKFIYGIIVSSIALSILMSPGLLNILFTANGFIPHGHCYLWKPGLVWLHVSSDSLIALAYVAISASLAYLVHRTRKAIPFHWMFLAFGSFIIACASTHFMDVWTLWHPTYWLAGGLKAITAIASVATAVILPPLIPKALALVETAKLSEERRLHLETTNQELEAVYGKLKELDQLKTQFFANVSHELRTPLALILGPTEKLLDSQNLTEDQRRSLSVADRNARLLLKQVNDLLDVSKLEAGKMEVNYAEVDLAQLVRLMAANFDGLAQERQISLAIEAPEVVLAQVDAVKIQRVLLNLLSNAFKFTPEGGKIQCTVSSRLASSLPDKAVPSEGNPPAALAVIAVQDSGPGIPPPMREVIFDRFHQGEGGVTRRFGGTGLGLAIVKEFVELQGGTIAVTDAAMGGAQFTVELPLAAPAGVDIATRAIEPDTTLELSLPILEELRARTAAPDSLQAQEVGKPLVLVIEDNSQMNQFITETLAADYRTATAKDGQEGLEQAIALHPDLILSDVMMPYVSGDQLVQQIRSYPVLDSTPIVMLTAKADDELRVQLLRQGAQDYLMKPFSVEELRARVSNLVAIKRTRDLLQQELASQSSDLEALAKEVSLRRRELQTALETLEHQAKELAQANRLKDEFLGIVSHELRTPLNAILGWAYTLRSRQLDEATATRALATIERNAKLQTQLVENLLDASCLLQGKVLLQMRPVNLQPIVEAAIQAVQPDAENKAIQLQVHAAGRVGLVSGDADRLQQIIQNLLSNAIKFTPNGGQVEIRLEQQADQVQLHVTDTGIGIRAESFPYLFDYFRQADSSTTRKFGGMGLGLTIVQQLVQLHQGQIHVASDGENQGATFTVTLPLKTPAAAAYPVL
ncbi:MAG TPA: ATP-binding protein [Coleofasciculaceae cyanobacterium]